MAERKRDWEVITAWEKRLAVDFGSIGPRHVRWSNWSWKERDIVARKVHESAGISRDHGPRSRRMEDWAKENAPIMVDFARDHGAMPDWAHAEFREAGVPEYVQVVWKRERPEDPASPADWAYDPPGPWAVIGDEPPWSSRPMDEAYNPNAGAGKAPAAAIPEGFVVQNMAWLGDKLALPVTDIVYPPHKDELLAMVESKDPTRGGWVTMSVLEAMGSGADYTEAVRDAAAVHFVVPLSYGIQDHAKAAFKLYFRQSNGGAQRPDYIDYEMIVPPQPDPAPRPKIIGLETEGSLHSKFGGVATYRVAANGDHIANDGTILSTAASRAKEDVPQWKKFELGRLDIVDNVVIPGPNALPRDEDQYGGNRKLTKRYELAQRAKMAAAPVGLAPGDAEYTPLEKVISWARERQHGLPHQVKWCRMALAMGHEWKGDFLPGMEPAWQGAERQGALTFKDCLAFYERHGRNQRWTLAREWFQENGAAVLAAPAGAADRDPIEDANRYRASVGLPPVEPSQADKLRAALGRVNERADVVVREFNPATGQLEEIRLTAAEARKREMDRYHAPVAMQGHYTAEQWRDRNGAPPIICMIEGEGRPTIFDPVARQPNWWLDGPGKPTQLWRQADDGGLVFVRNLEEAGHDKPPKPPASPARPVGDDILGGGDAGSGLDGGPALPAGGDGGLVKAQEAIDEIMPPDMAAAARAQDWKQLALLALMKG